MAVSKLSKIQIHNCPSETKRKEVKEKEVMYSEIRPLVRLFRKTSPDPPSQQVSESQPVQNKTKEISREVDSPVRVPHYRKYSQVDTPKSSIKFSTSTALYTPPKPSLQNYSKPDNSLNYGKARGGSLARSSLFSTYNLTNLTARARSEFRERSIPVGRRNYVSLYS